MIRNLKPVQVSPIIKSARWGFLIFGIVYGNTKLKAYRALEETEHVIREKLIKEKYERLALESKRKTTEAFEDIAKNLDYTELPPEWIKEI